MNIIGRTTDDKPVVDGVYKFVGTYGMPLDVVLAYLHKEGFVVSWYHFIIDALNEGMSPRSIKAKVIAAVQDVQGFKYAEEFEKRLLTLLPN